LSDRRRRHTTSCFGSWFIRQAFDAKTVFEQTKATLTEVSINMFDKMAAKGCYNNETHEIMIRNNLTDTQKVKTLIHEYAHHMHHISCFEDEDYCLSEIIAESSEAECFV